MAESMPRRPAAADLRRIRQRVDALDRRIVRLLNERAKLGLEAGAAKAGRGTAVRDPEREREVLRRVCEASEGPLSSDALRSIYRRIMAETRRLEADDRPSESPGDRAEDPPARAGREEDLAAPEDREAR